MIEPRDDRFVITKSEWNTNPWTVWLPAGQRWLQLEDGSMIATTHSGGFESFDDAKKFVAKRLSSKGKNDE